MPRRKSFKLETENSSSLTWTQFLDENDPPTEPSPNNNQVNQTINDLKRTTSKIDLLDNANNGDTQSETEKSVDKTIDNKVRDKKFYTFAFMETVEHKRRKSVLKIPIEDVVVCKRFNLNVRSSDIFMLLFHRCINDAIINFYMQLIVKRAQKDATLPKVHSINSYFATLLINSGYTNVNKWIKKIDIFAYDILLIPIHSIDRWSLVVVNFKSKTIRHFDSINKPDNAVLNAIVDFIQFEVITRNNLLYNMKEFATDYVQDCQRLSNPIDSGILCCMNAKNLSVNQPVDYCLKNISNIRKRMVLDILRNSL